jgi:hypothetical protein
MTKAVNECPPEAMVRYWEHDYLTFRGPLPAWSRFPTYRNWWWPEDRAWCIQVDIDNHDTNSALIGASTECAAAIFNTPAIEALAARPGDPAGMALF